MIIRAIDAIFTWTPNRDLDETEINPLRGTVHVSTFPESALALQHSNSFGACNIGWEQIDNRWRMAQWMVIEMIHRLYPSMKCDEHAYKRMSLRPSNFLLKRRKMTIRSECLLFSSNRRRFASVLFLRK